MIIPGVLRAVSRELATVPDELRSVLENCLSEEATPQTLDQYLPGVRKIITKLLQGLRSKQSIYRQVVSDNRQRSSTVSEASSSRPESRASRTSRRDTTTSTRSGNHDGVQPSDSLSRRSATSTRRKESASGVPQLPHEPEQERFVGGFAPAALPPSEAMRVSFPTQPQSRHEWAESTPRPPSRTSSAVAATAESHRDSHAEVSSVSRPQSQVPSHVKRYSLVDRPVTSPTPPPTTPMPPSVVVVEEPPVLNGTVAHDSPQDSPPLPPPPPPPPFLDSPPPDAPAVQSSLAALKQSDALERRASKRFSTYNISKMTGGTIRGMGANRRSMAVASGLTPGDLAVLTEENEDESPPPMRRRPSKRSRNPSPIATIAEDEEESTPPVPPIPSPSRGPSRGPSPKPSIKSDAGKDLPLRPADSSTDGPRPTGPFPVFLQVGREVKKVIIEPSLSLASLRVLFVDKFSYSPGQGNFPAIYIQDPASKVQYELEDMEEVKEKCLLSLNIEREYHVKICVASVN